MCVGWEGGRVLLLVVFDNIMDGSMQILCLSVVVCCLLPCHVMVCLSMPLMDGGCDGIVWCNVCLFVHG